MVLGNAVIVHQGWLTKSPPPKRILKMQRWRKRWFVLRLGELPNQFLLEYYVDQNCRKMKGHIDLDQCEQIDAGIMFASEKEANENNFMFDIKTPSRIYYLKSDTEHEMNKWVDVLCQACGLKAQNEDGMPQNMASSLLPPLTPLSGPPIDLLFSQYSGPESSISPGSISSISGPYIPISECITGRKVSSNNQSNNNNPRNMSRFPFQHSPGSHKKLNIPTEVAPSVPCNASSMVSLSTPSTASTTLLEDIPHDGMKPRSADFHEQMRSLRASSHSSAADEGLGATGFRSPLTDTSSSVFTDEDLSANCHSAGAYGHRNGKKDSDRSDAPPRPPKPAHLEVPQQNYMNIESVSRSASCRKISNDRKLNTVSMSHDITSSSDAEASPLSACSSLTSAPTPGASASSYNRDVDKKNSIYNNTQFSGNSDRVFSYDLKESDAELYSNMTAVNCYVKPTPVPPPSVNRGLKPKVSLSDASSHSGCDGSPLDALVPPSSAAPVVNRNLKPAANSRTNNSSLTVPKDFVLDPAPRSRPKGGGLSSPASRAAPSPTPPQGGELESPGTDSEQVHPPLSARSWRNSIMHDDTVFYPLSATRSPGSEIQYLDLDLNGIKNEATPSTSERGHKKDTKVRESDASDSLTPSGPPVVSSSVEYHLVDFVKTDALSKMKKDIEENYSKNNQ